MDSTDNLPEVRPREVNLCELSAAELGQRYAALELSPVEVCEAVAERISRSEPVLNAFYCWDAEAALVAAKESADRWLRGKPLSVLDGVPGTVKENIARRGVPVPSGTALPNPPVATQNAPITDRLEEAGVVILGSTTMPDWGMLSSGVSSLHGITRSPGNPAWTSGGSSAGAGVAAAAGYGPLHVGTDIGGSIRLPGTWLGLSTLKPSAGRVPLSAPYLGRAAGPMARSIQDATLLLNQIGQFDFRDYTARPYPQDGFEADFTPKARRIALQLNAGVGTAVEPEVAQAVTAVATLFEQAGAAVEILPAFLSQSALDALDNFWRTRSYKDYLALSAPDRECVLPYIVLWCARGAEFSGAQTIAHYEAIAQIQQATVSATWPYDLVISPVAPMPAFPAEQPMPVPDPEQTMAHIGFTVPYNMSGQPAATVNCGFTVEGKPIGVQIAARVGEDYKVLEAAAWYERNRPQSATPVWPTPPQ